MSRRRRTLASALLGVLLQVTATASVASQVVVCRAPSGHVELETAFAGDCCGRDVARGSVQLAGNACDGCIDTPFDGLCYPTAVKEMAVGVTPLALPVSLAWQHRPASRPAGIERGVSPLPRTVVLLI